MSGSNWRSRPTTDAERARARTEAVRTAPSTRRPSFPSSLTENLAPTNNGAGSWRTSHLRRHIANRSGLGTAAPPEEMRGQHAHPTNALKTNTIMTTIKVDDESIFGPVGQQQTSGAPITIGEVKFLGSYNWVRSDTPTIYVPGTPAAFDPPSLPFKLPKDEVEDPDENRERTTAPRWASFFATMLLMQRNYCFQEVGLVSDRSSIRKLFNFVAGIKQESFRIDAQLVEGNLFLSRWVRSNGRFKNKYHESGYGFGFEKSSLHYEGQVEDSSSHIRISEFKLGPMKIIMQAEADGYLPAAAASIPAQTIQTTKKDIPAVDGLTVIQKGRLIDPGSILEIKCAAKAIPWNIQKTRALSQCWLSQTKHLLAGQHNFGDIESVLQADMTAEFLAWESNPNIQENLHKLLKLMGKIKQLAFESHQGRVYVILAWEKQTELGFIMARDYTGCSLSDDVKGCFWPRPERD